MITTIPQFKQLTRGAGYVQVLRLRGSRPLLQIATTGQVEEMSFALYRQLVYTGQLVECQASKTAVACEVVYA